MNKYYSSSIVNIDSKYRELYPKHIYNTSLLNLKDNPLTFTANSNIVKINCKNHGLLSRDNITINGISGASKVLNNAFYLMNEINYLIIKINNNIDIKYKKYVIDIYLNISLIDNQIINNYIGNIPINSFLGIKKYYLYNEISINKFKFDILTKELLNISASEANASNDSIINNNFIFIDIGLNYSNLVDNYILLDYIFKLTFLHINGISLGYLNANYPINDLNYQSSHCIYSIIDLDNFEILINAFSCISNTTGGNNISIDKIFNSIEGYPEPNEYVINLKKPFNNVVAIELLSLEIPNVNNLIKKNYNDKLYWKNLDDGEHIYNIQLDEGFYDSKLLVKMLNNQMNLTKKINYTDTNKEFNIFDINIELLLNKITFISYKIIKLPNSFSIKIENIDGVLYFVLNIIQKNNTLIKNDKITIYEADNISFYDENNNIKIIDAVYINKEHIIYYVDTNNSYDILLDTVVKIKYSNYTEQLFGGKNIRIKMNSKFSLLFDKNNTIGEILGFKNVGSIFSNTDFKYEISNTDNYINSTNMNAIGNKINYTNGYLNLCGNYSYMLMYINDIEYVYNNNLDSCFCKILLPNLPNEILFNTFVINSPNLYSNSFPITTLVDLKIKFIYPDGSKVNFKNLNHSFTLRIIEEKIK